MVILDSISNDLLIDKEIILSTLRREKRNYRKINLPSGRVVWQPCPQLKALQYWICDFLSKYGPKPSPHTTAYEPGCNIVKNANIHKNSKHVLKTDIENFFPSIGKNLVNPYLESIESIALSEEDIALIDKIVFLDEGLIMGAPSSPMIANRAMITIDEEINTYCKISNPPLVYTRYSDDLFFSSKQKIDTSAIEYIDSILHKYNLSLNRRKTKLMGRGSNRMMAGVAINASNKLSLGQKRKKYLKKVLYSFCLSESPSKESAYQLQGLLSFAKMIEPLYVNSLLLKYSRYSNEPIQQKIKRVSSE